MEGLVGIETSPRLGECGRSGLGRSRKEKITDCHTTATLVKNWVPNTKRDDGDSTKSEIS